MTADYTIYQTLLSKDVSITTAIKFFIGDMEIKWFSDAIERGALDIMFRFETNGTDTKRVCVEFEIKCTDVEVIKVVVSKEILYTETSELGAWFAELLKEEEC